MSTSAVTTGFLTLLLLLSPVAGRRLHAGERAPSLILRGLGGEEVRYAPPGKDSGGEGGNAPAVTILLFIDPGQDHSLDALDDLRTCLERPPEAGARIRALAVAGGDLDEDAAAALRRRLPAKGAILAAVDPQRDAFRKYGVIAIPTTFVIDARGTISKVLPGRSSAYRKHLAEALREALGLEPAEDPAQGEPDPAARKAGRLRKLAADLAARGRPAEAARLLREACGLAPGDPSLCVALGEVLLELGDGKAASEAFGAALAAAPGDRSARAGRAKALALGEDLEAAEKALRAELALPGAHSSLSYYLGRVLERRGDAAGAAAAYRRAYESLERGR